MDSTSSAESAGSSTVLGSFDVLLRVDPGSGTSGIVIRPLSSSDRLGRDLALVISSLLFIQRQIRAVSDSARFSAIAGLNAACVSARDGHVVKPTVPSGARLAATYRIDLLADGSFYVNVDQKLDGILEDPAGILSSTGLALEILTTCSEPHRSFFRQMLEAAASFWRLRRPSSVESTWDWAVALRQLDQLSRGITDPFAPTQMCETCGAVRPVGSSCLRCGAEPGSARPVGRPGAPVQVAPPLSDNVAGALSLGITLSPPPTGPITATVTAPAQPPIPRVERVAEILKATPSVPADPGGANDFDDTLPLAGLPRRFAAFVLDLASGALLGAIGTFGLLAILISTGGLMASDDPRGIVTFSVLAIVLLYLVLGWSRGETLGMLVTRTRLLRRDNGKPSGLPSAFMRVVGSVVIFGLGLIAFTIIWLIDNNLSFVQGLADRAIRVGGGAVGMYIIWLGTGRAIIGQPTRQTLPDRLGGTIVAIRR